MLRRKRIVERHSAWRLNVAERIDRNIVWERCCEHLR